MYVHNIKEQRKERYNSYVNSLYKLRGYRCKIRNIARRNTGMDKVVRFTGELREKGIEYKVEKTKTGKAIVFLEVPKREENELVALCDVRKREFNKYVNKVSKKPYVEKVEYVANYTAVQVSLNDTIFETKKGYDLIAKVGSWEIIRDGYGLGVANSSFTDRFVIYDADKARVGYDSPQAIPKIVKNKIEKLAYLKIIWNRM